MGKKRLVSLVLAVSFLVFTSTAAAGGWAGSRYDKKNCIYDAGSDVLSCSAWFADETYTTMTFGISDATCASTIRIVERTGWQVTTYRGWGVFSGRVPTQQNELFGNEDSFEVSWGTYIDVDLGCSP
jgi:hypothetical protein